MDLEFTKNFSALYMNFKYDQSNDIRDIQNTTFLPFFERHVFTILVTNKMLSLLHNKYNIKIEYLKSNQLNCSDLNLHEKLKLSKNHQLSKSQQDSHTRENNEHVICHCKKVIVNVSILSSLTIFTTDSA